MPIPSSLATARTAYARRTWADAHDAFTRASTEAPLDADDTERAAWSAVLSGRDESAFEHFERLYEMRVSAGEHLRAAQAAFWMGMRLSAVYADVGISAD